MRNKRLRSALAARGATFAAIAVAAATIGGGAGTADAHLLPNGSFEGTLAGWTPLSGAALSLASDGVVGAQAVRAALPAGSISTSFGLIASPPVVASTAAKQIYNAGG